MKRIFPKPMKNFPKDQLSFVNSHIPCLAKALSFLIPSFVYTLVSC